MVAARSGGGFRPCCSHEPRSIRLPIFPLPGAILFPRSQLPLHIFEPRYREMVRDAIDGAGRIGMIQPHGSTRTTRRRSMRVGCVGEIVGVEELDDGRFNIVLLGSNRFRLIARARSRHRLSLRGSRHRGIR